MTETTTLRLPEKKLRALRVAAGLLNIPMSRIIEEALDDHLEDIFDSAEAEKALDEEGGFTLSELKKEWDL
tara:strand:+ start:1735 stop:1947 length:213 start_codon:yes stop_codon:yes gene_type:complete